MTTRTFKTNVQYANDLACGARTFMFRSLSDNLRTGDRVIFEPWDNRHKVHHPINDMEFEISHVDRTSPQMAAGIVGVSLKRVLKKPHPKVRH